MGLSFDCFYKSITQQLSLQLILCLIKKIKCESEAMVKTLRIGKHVARYPVIQGGMGVRISAGRLAGNVAKCGGIGLVAA